ncbi:hypothetical protein GF415_04885 [Candidatus Micrarchaeota archaeon]|nr:hypothetical protein [Candidatus Micrarchaeota archaeon]
MGEKKDPYKELKKYKKKLKEEEPDIFDKEVGILTGSKKKKKKKEE